MDSNAAKGREPSLEVKKAPSPPATMESRKPVSQSSPRSDRGRGTSGPASPSKPLSSAEHGNAACRASPVQGGGSPQPGRGRGTPAAHADGASTVTPKAARAAHQRPAGGGHIVFQALGPEDLVAASRTCLEQVQGELNIVTSSTVGGSAAEASDSGASKPSPSTTPLGHLDRRVCFGMTSVSGAQESSMDVPQETSLGGSLASAGAASGATDSVDTTHPGVRKPPKVRPLATYDEFDSSVNEEVGTVPDEEDDTLDPEARIRRRHSSTASCTSGISDELDAPVFAGRVKPALGTLSATPSPPAEDQLGAVASPREDGAWRELDAADAGCKTGGSSADAGGTTERRKSILASPKRETAEHPHGQDQGAQNADDELRDEIAVKAAPDILGSPALQSEMSTPPQVHSPPDYFSSPMIGSVGSEEPGAIRGIGSIGSEEPKRDFFSSRFTQSLSAVLRNAIVAATSRRFYMLAIYCVASLVNGFQWIEYAIIASVIQDYYGVSEVAVAWTSLVYHIGCVTLALPSSWIMENMGLRASVILGAVGTSIGSCVKVFSVRPDRFGYVLIGQTFPAFSLAFIVAVPSRLASTWFRYEEVSTACSVGVLGSQVGIALGFFIPPYVVDPNNVQMTLTTLCVAVAVVSVACLLVAIVAFEDKPEHPPSFCEMLNRYNERKPTFTEALSELMADRDFRLLLLSYGINTGAFYSISTLLNPVVMRYFPGEENFAGLLGVTIVVSGLLGSWAAGWVLDRTGKYKEVSVVTYAFSTLGLIAYTFVLSLRSRWLTGTACFFLGFFLAGYIPVGLQLGAEITYPLPEGTSASVLNMAAESFGFVLILSSSNVLGAYGDRVSNLALSALLLVGCACIVALRATLKRKLATLRVQRKRLPSPGGGLRA
ncbi:choline/ethanolamine transporter FLVCR2-like [Dermacentor albipictus]|uniref:choline/ethanolamine transporter FLVCR2-like n=1 Tax=Dermacentor albipictus TaxID=60249 RepID=UPI0038FCC16B